VIELLPIIGLCLVSLAGGVIIGSRKSGAGRPAPRLAPRLAPQLPRAASYMDSYMGPYMGPYTLLSNGRGSAYRAVQHGAPMAVKIAQRGG
jgi:hypothetical protein